MGKFLLIVIAAALIACVCASTLADAKSAREIACSTDTDCVTVRHGKGNQLVVDGLVFAKSTPNDVLAKLPSWFGPRPAELVVGAKALDPDVPFAAQGIKKPAEVVNIRKRAESKGDL